jgi:hypothetical protein
MTTPSKPPRSPGSLYEEGLRHLDEASHAARIVIGGGERITAAASLATAYFAAATLALEFDRTRSRTTRQTTNADVDDAVLPTSDGSAIAQASPAVVSLRQQARRFSWTELEGDVDHLLFGHYRGNRLLAVWLADGEVIAAALDGASMPVGNVPYTLRQLGFAATVENALASDS